MYFMTNNIRTFPGPYSKPIMQGHTLGKYKPFVLFFRSPFYAKPARSMHYHHYTKKQNTPT